MSEQANYPDILGMLSDERLTIGEVLQCVLGVFPPTTALEKPIEVLLLLQNLTNQPLPLRLTIRTPTHDSHGNLVNFFTPKPRLAMSLAAGECGLLHIPITPQLPTQPGTGYPVRVQIDVQPPDAFLRVRSLEGGEEPNLLAISPFRIAVLREIAFSAQSPAEHQLEVTFEVLPGRFPPHDEVTPPRYEALWTMREMEAGEEQAKASAGEALSFAKTLSTNTLYPVLLERTRIAFGDAGMPLHPGEMIFISKILTYVMEEGLELEQGFSLAESHWFKRLCRLMADDSSVINNLDHLIRLVYTAAVQDAAALGFTMVSFDTGADFGDELERMDYASRLVAALEGRAPLSLEHIYVPLVMAGVLVHARVTIPDENLWDSLDDIVEARDGRISLAGAAFAEVFTILNTLIERAERLLTETRVPRP